MPRRIGIGRGEMGDGDGGSRVPLSGTRAAVAVDMTISG